MGLDRLGNFLRRHPRIGVDSSIFIYQVEANARYYGFTQKIFSSLDRGSSSAVTSTITMTELLAQPYRVLDEQRVDQFQGLISTYPNLEWVAPSLEIADLAARIRGTHHLRTPDALQAATALQTQASGFLTNDKAFERVTGFECLVLEHLL